MNNRNTPERPLVSLCMATCQRSNNDAARLARLFPESFAALLKQTYSPLEIVVLADGADPETIRILEACKDARLRWIATPRPSGMVPAWNRVCGEAKGKYFLFCADDDVLTDQAIDRQVAMLESDPRMVFAHADFFYIDDDGKQLSRSSSPRGTFTMRGLEAWPRYLENTSCCMQTTVVRKDAWDQVGGWDTDAGNPADNSLYLKLLRIGDEGHVAYAACRYRIRTRNPDPWEKQFRDLRENYVLACKHLIDPPDGLRMSVPALRRRMLNRLSRIGVSVLRDAPSSAQRDEAKVWLKKNVWSGCAWGFACHMAESGHALGLIEGVLRAEGQLRKVAKSVVLARHRFSSAS